MGTLLPTAAGLWLLRREGCRRWRGWGWSEGTGGGQTQTPWSCRLTRFSPLRFSSFRLTLPLPGSLPRLIPSSLTDTWFKHFVSLANGGIWCQPGWTYIPWWWGPLYGIRDTRLLAHDH